LPIGKKNTKKSLKKAKKPLKLEGCLSIPKIWSPVARAKKILLEYQDLTCQVKREWFQGFKAIIIQHEVDHLNGILFTQRALEQKNPLYEEKEGKLKKLRY
jgi:peptide deformylase